MLDSPKTVSYTHLDVYKRQASYYLWRSKFGGMSVPDAKRLKDLEAENTRLKKLLAEQVFENDLIKDALRKKW